MPSHDDRANLLLGVVLAGGRSHRMGSDKAVIALPSGQTFLEHSLVRLTSLGLAVAVSGTPRDSCDVVYVPDRKQTLGPAVAVWSCLDYAIEQGFAGMLVTPVDMPDLTSQALSPLVNAFDRSRPVAATFDGETPHPLLAVYPASAIESLRQVAQSPRRSLREWLQQQGCKMIPLDSQWMRDCNRPEDL